MLQHNISKYIFIFDKNNTVHHIKWLPLPAWNLLTELKISREKSHIWYTYISELHRNCTCRNDTIPTSFDNNIEEELPIIFFPHISQKLYQYLLIKGSKENTLCCSHKPENSWDVRILILPIFGQNEVHSNQKASVAPKNIQKLKAGAKT